VPDYARNAQGNIAEQNRQYGPFRGADSTKPPLAKLPRASAQGMAHASEMHAASKGPEQYLRVRIALHATL
jgi:cytochrome c